MEVFDDEEGSDEYGQNANQFWTGDRVYVDAAGWGSAYTYEIGGFKSGGNKVRNVNVKFRISNLEFMKWQNLNFTASS